MSTLIFAIPFYFNYFILVPNILNKITFTRVFIWVVSYSLIHFATCYPLYDLFPNVFITPSIVNSTSKIGAVIHISFFYITFSTGSRMVFQWVKNTKVAHRLYMQKRDNEINELKVGMSFPFVEGVLQQLEKEIDEPQNIVKSITSLSKVLRFKLYRKQDDSIMLNDEVKIIERYLSLLSICDHSDWKIEIKENMWVEKGIAFLRVEECLNYTNFTGGTLLISMKNDEIFVSLKEEL